MLSTFKVFMHDVWEAWTQLSFQQGPNYENRYQQKHGQAFLSSLRKNTLSSCAH